MLRCGEEGEGGQERGKGCICAGEEETKKYGPFIPLFLPPLFLTCAREAEAIGTGSNELQSSAGVFPSSSLITAHTSS